MLNHPIKMTILGGFLGSGKTTVLNNIIRNLPEGERTAILINDFGDVSIDALLIEKGDYSKKEIKGGCICCNLKEKLLQTLLFMVNEEKPDHIYIEATGLAVPWEMKKSINSNFATDKIQVSEVLVCTDALQFNRFHDYLPAYSRQFEGEPFVLMTKADIHNTMTLKQMKEKLCRHYPGISGFAESIDGVWSPAVTLVQKEETLSTGMKSFLQQLKMIDTGLDGINQLSYKGTLLGSLEHLKSLIIKNKDKVIRLKGLIPLNNVWYNLQYDGEILSEKIIDLEDSELTNQGILTLFCMEEHRPDLNNTFSQIFKNLKT